MYKKLYVKKDSYNYILYGQKLTKEGRLVDQKIGFYTSLSGLFDGMVNAILTTEESKDTTIILKDIKGCIELMNEFKKTL